MRYLACFEDLALKLPRFFLLKYVERQAFSRKVVDDIMGGEDDWANVDKDDGEHRPRAQYVKSDIFVNSAMSKYTS